MANHLGIDIGPNTVRAALVSTGFKKLRLESLAQVNIEAAGGRDEAIRKVIADATAGKGSGQDGVSVALDGHRAVTRNLALPASAQKQMAEVLPFELESEVPFGIQDAVWDYRVLQRPPFQDKRSEEISLLVTIAKVAEVRKCIDDIKLATTQEPERVSVGAFPLANVLAMRQASTDAPTVLVDMGEKRSDVLFIVAGEAVFARAILIGTEGLPHTAARLAREIRTTIAAFRAIGWSEPTQLFLSGNGAFVSGAESFLSAELGLPVSLLQSPTFEMGPGVSQESLSNFPAFAKSVGLALGLAQSPKDVNLRRGPLGFERGFSWIKEHLPVLLGLGVIIVLAFYLSTFMELFALARERTVLEKALETVTLDVLGEATSEPDKAAQLLAAQTTLADDDPMPHADAFHVLVRFSEAVPQSTVHDIEEFDFQKNHTRIRGVVGTVGEAQQIAESLKKIDPCFSDVKITRTNQVVGQDRQKYELEFDLKCPEDQKVTKKKETAASPSTTASAGGTK